MANIDLGNLTRYDGKIKEYVEDKYLSKNTANWQMTNKAGAVTCYPVPDTELEPIVDFSFKEIPPVSGEKSPSNPSTIEGVSSIKMTRCGRNIIKYPFYQTTRTVNGITFTDNGNGTITANGTASDLTQFAFINPYWNPNGGKLLPVGTYRLSGCPAGGYWNTYKLKVVFSSIYSDYVTALIDIGSGSTVTVTKASIVSWMIEISRGTTVSNLVFKPQLELGSTITSFELYSGTDYTVNIGNTYYGGSVNLATGLMTVTQFYYEFDGTEICALDYTYENTCRILTSMSNVAPCPLMSYLTVPLQSRDAPDNYLLRCSHYKYQREWYDKVGINITGVIAQNKGFLRFFSPKSLVSSAQDFKDFLASQYANGTPVTVTYPIQNPYVVQLNPVQIKSLTALDKNTPRLNTLYTDADSIQVGYQKHPARTAYELENAILALGGGE